MGYDLTIKIKGELDSQFVPFVKKVDECNIDEYRNTIIITCLNGKQTDAPFDIMKVNKNLKFIFDVYIQNLEQRWKIELKNRLTTENGEYYFRGWQYSNASSNYDAEESLRHIYRNLLIYCVGITTPDFQEDDQIFWDFEHKIREELDCAEEAVSDMWDAKFLDFYKNNNELAETEESY